MSDPYRFIAHVYDRALEPLTAPLRELALRFIAPEPGSRVLDIGCGTGTMSVLFLDAGCEVVAVEPSPAMFSKARQKLYGRARLHLGSAATLPFASGSFDLAFLMLTLHEMREPMRLSVLQEAARLTSGRGNIMVVDFNKGPLAAGKGWLYRGVQVAAEISAGREHFRNYRDYMARGGLLPLLERAGLEPLRSKVVSGGNTILALAKA